MEDNRRQTQSQIVPNNSTISLDYIMVSSNLHGYKDLLRGKQKPLAITLKFKRMIQIGCFCLDFGIHSVSDLYKTSKQQLSHISNEMSNYDKKEFLNLCSRIKKCSTPEDLELMIGLVRIGNSEFFSKFSGIQNVAL